MNSRSTRASVAALLALVLWAGAPGAAHAAPGDIADSNNSDVSVSVPPAAPAPGSSTPPVNTTPPAPGGGGNTGGGNAGPVGAPGGGTAPPAGGGGAATTGGAANTAPAACVPKEPTVPQTPATGGNEASVDKDVYSAGETVTATAAGFGAGEQVQLVLFSEPALVGNFAADATGAVTAQFMIAAETLAGMHTVQFTGWCGSTSTADLLVGATNSAGTAGPQGVPPWLWWIGGGLGAVLLVLGAWWALRVMRAPAAIEAVPA